MKIRGGFLNKAAGMTRCIYSDIFQPCMVVLKPLQNGLLFSSWTTIPNVSFSLFFLKTFSVILVLISHYGAW